MYCTHYIPSVLICICTINKIISITSGASPGFGSGGAKNFFFGFGNLHVAKRHAAHGEAMRIARGVRGMLPRENFLKRCNLVRFRVYFDQILYLFFFRNYHFLYKKYLF